MSKLPQVAGPACIDALSKAGFYIARQRGSHVTLRRFYPAIRVTFPNHRKWIKPSTLYNIIRQAGMTVAEFNRLL